VTVNEIQDFRFSRWCFRGFGSFGIWCCVFVWKLPSVSKECNAIIFRKAREPRRILLESLDHVLNGTASLPKDWILLSQLCAILGYSDTLRCVHSNENINKLEVVVTNLASCHCPSWFGAFCMGMLLIVIIIFSLIWQLPKMEYVRDYPKFKVIIEHSTVQNMLKQMAEPL